MDTIRIPHVTDMDLYKDDTDQLWLFAEALRAACIRGKLQNLPSARALSNACLNIMQEIEKQD